MMNRTLLRKSDIVLWVAIITFFSLIYKPMRKIVRMDESVDKILGLEQRMTAAERSIAVNNAQYSEILNQVKEINSYLRKRGARNDPRSEAE